MAIKNKLAAVLTVAVLISPAFVLADNGQSRNPAADASQQKNAAAAQNFCTRLSDYSSRVINQINDSKNKLSSNRDDQSKTIADRRRQEDRELQQTRITDQQRRQSAFNQLDAMATTDAEKQAVSQFETTIIAAIRARQSAVDAAMHAYQTGVKNIIARRGTAEQTAEQNFENAVQAAITNATAQCAAGTSATSVRDTLNAALKAARTQFQADRKAVDKAGSQISALAQTRNAAVKKAMSDFQTALNSARTALKAAFARSAPAGSSSGTGSGSSSSGSGQ